MKLGDKVEFIVRGRIVADNGVVGWLIQIEDTGQLPNPQLFVDKDYPMLLFQTGEKHGLK
mgnify:CR=1 FL=1